MPLRITAAIVSGVLFALAFPNYSIGWLMFVAVVPLLVAVVRAKSWPEAFFLGWISQTIAWLMMVPWVVRVMSHYGGLSLPTGISIFVAMCVILGLYGAAFALIVFRIAPRADFLRWLLVPVAWAAIEYARTYLLTGFPWNLIAASIVDYTPLVQFDRVAGPYALGVLILLPSVLIAWLIVGRPRGMRLVAGVAPVVIVMFVWWMTGLIASKLIPRPRVGATYTAALLQPNISQEMRWDDASLLAIFNRMINMTDSAIRRGASVVIWPESTVPLSYSSSDFFRDAIEGISRRAAVDIILGSVAEDATRPDTMWNSAFLVSGGQTIGHYDKIRLVPFGEYVPLRKMLFFAHKLVHEVGNFEFGTKDTPLVGMLRYGPAICYEIVFPQIARMQVVHGADVLVTITNDAWYDGTSAPRQHLNQARLRAVETDRYLLRAATTGISAFVTPSGEIVSEIPMNNQGILYARFQPRQSRTLYVRFGDWFAWIACAITAVAVLRNERRNAHQNS
ncbi:MAG TPA: apolipoprotein N-acyltransferase [Thermoanaerobaculia bacterium]|nr:apolipoprotein N-acyltransferase [Thermoanaerobaculia bacterium]